MKVKTKISSINSLQEALLVVQEKPDIIEVIVEIKSGVDVRTKSKEEAFIILDQVKRKVETCILTDKTEINELQRLLEGLPCDYIFPIFQLHNTVMKKIKIYFPYLKIVPTIHVVDRSALKEVESLNVNPYVDMIHLDSKTKNKLGGTGQTHDWSISKEIVQLSIKPVILAGGLNPQNVRDAVKVVKPWGVDTYSGVLNEKKDLDINKVKQFIQNAKH